MSGSDIEQEHPSDCFSWPPAKGLEWSFTTAHNNLFSKVVLLTKTKAQAGCGCPAKLQTPPFVLLNGKPDTGWQSGCWCLPPNACERVRVEGRRMQWNPTGVFQQSPGQAPEVCRLPVEFSISWLVLLTSNCLQALAPRWLSDLLQLITSSRTRRSPSRPAEFGHRAFWRHQILHLGL